QGAAGAVRVFGPGSSPDSPGHVVAAAAVGAASAATPCGVITRAAGEAWPPPRRRPPRGQDRLGALPLRPARAVLTVPLPTPRTAPCLPHVPGVSAEGSRL